MSTGRAILIGAGMAVLAVAIVAALVVTGVLGGLRRPDAATQGPVLVALVLPDETGISQPRVVDVYSKTPSGWQVASVSPTLPAVVSGTSGKTLADAYTFGGGDALASAYSELGRGTVTAWLIVNESAWTGLLGSTRATIDVPAHMEVFDGSHLSVFEQGATSISATQTIVLLEGARYLSTGDSQSLRSGIGDALATQLRVAGLQNAAALQSNLTSVQLSAWLREVGTPARKPGD